MNPFQRYDMTTSTWTSLSPPTKSRRYPAVCLKGDSIILCGGYDCDSCEAYNPQLNTYVVNQFLLYKRLHYRSLSWSHLPNMTTQRDAFGLFCFPPFGSLIAVGGSNKESGYLKSVEVLRDGNCNEWKRVASLLVPMGHPGVEYFRDRVFVLGGVSNCLLSIPTIYMSNKPGSVLIEQWIILDPRWRHPSNAALLTAFNDQLFFISESLEIRHSPLRLIEIAFFL